MYNFTFPTEKKKQEKITNIVTFLGIVSFTPQRSLSLAREYTARPVSGKTKSR